LKLLFTAFLAILLLAGCSSPQPEGSYPKVVALNNILFGLSVEPITQNKMGNQIGVVKRLVQIMPKANEESNDAPVGSKLFEIKGIDSSEAIAVEINGKYRKAIKNGPLK
jgi:hypothetical protein